MGGSPIITESSHMVSSPLHVTASLGERLVKTPNFGGRAGVRISHNSKSDDVGVRFFEAPLSDDSANGSQSDLLFRRSSAPRVAKDRHVAFGTICTRSYAVVMGDHPCCSMGCPLALGWEYSQDPTVSVDQYESSRSPRRSREDLKTTWEQRRNRLSDVSDGEVKRAERKFHRERSCQRRNRSRVCAAFFQLDGIPEDPTAGAAAGAATVTQRQCT